MPRTTFFDPIRDSRDVRERDTDDDTAAPLAKKRKPSPSDDETPSDSGEKSLSTEDSKPPAKPSKGEKVSRRRGQATLREGQASETRSDLWEARAKNSASRAATPSDNSTRDTQQDQGPLSQHGQTTVAIAGVVIEVSIDSSVKSTSSSYNVIVHSTMGNRFIGSITGTIDGSPLNCCEVAGTLAGITCRPGHYTANFTGTIIGTDKTGVGRFATLTGMYFGTIPYDHRIDQSDGCMAPDKEPTVQQTALESATSELPKVAPLSDEESPGKPHCNISPDREDTVQSGPPATDPGAATKPSPPAAPHSHVDLSQNSDSEEDLSPAHTRNEADNQCLSACAAKEGDASKSHKKQSIQGQNPGGDKPVNKGTKKRHNPRKEIYRGPPHEDLSDVGGWPKGWFKTTLQSASGRTDSYWHSPDERKFQSVPDVKRFLTQKVVRKRGTFQPARKCSTQFRSPPKVHTNKRGMTKSAAIRRRAGLEVYRGPPQEDMSELGGWPPGWTKVIREIEVGKKSVCWWSPSSVRCRSMKEVKLHIQKRMISGADEHEGKKDS